MAKVKHNPKPGDRHGRLVVNGEVFRHGPRKIRTVPCRCDCGADKNASIGDLYSGRVTSCGCAKRENGKFLGSRKTHGYARTPTYYSWNSMRQRCLDPNTNGYERYGGRGIRVCGRWLKFENFLEDMGERPDGTTIDRIDNNGDYEPGNCRWATDREQKMNRRHAVIIAHNGETLLATEWAERLGVHRNTIYRRLKRGWPIEKVLTR